ncbi:hypothetical protein C5167_015230 [Papaver somniferum]|uniref:Uncharacterized protein n=1 Tax=Papaver somniferum TaxID=3469 RepID=A0A4Y7J5F9_PAPSO|nr:hypothetical protein C5167_015230 [Papaver somniferum]
MMRKRKQVEIKIEAEKTNKGASNKNIKSTCKKRNTTEIDRDEEEGGSIHEDQTDIDIDEEEDYCTCPLC